MTNPNQEMSLERLRALVDSYGANLAHFPLAERAQAEALLGRSEAARNLWEEAKGLDDLLAERPASLAPSAALMQRLKAIPVRESQARAHTDNVVHLPRRATAWASLAAAAALLLGVFTGTQQSDESSGERATQVEQDDDTAALTEFAALALGGELVTDLGQFEGDAE